MGTHPVADAIRLTAARALSDVVATTSKPRSNLKMENGMTAIAKVFWRVFPRASSDSGPLVTIALLCGIGLLASLCLATYGLDLSAGGY
ncbi:ArsR family metal-binding transcriptional regulator [Nitrobacteraceae bacterium AZCC 2146]